MKIRLLSDLHHEHFDGRRQLPEVEADVVVLAGDIHSHLEGLHWARETFANSEIVYRLERSNELEEELARANRMVDELLAKNQRLQAELAAANAPQVAEA